MKRSFLASLDTPSKRTNQGFRARKNDSYCRAQANHRRGFRLGLESLEGRLLLTNLVVNTTQDYDESGYFTLRDAVNQANADAASSIATLGTAAATAANELSGSPGAGPGDGDLLGMPLAQVTELDPPQGEPVQVAAATAVNRLKTLDAVFAAGDFTDQDQGTGPQSGKRSSDDTDAWFVADELAAWGTKLTNLRTSLTSGARS